MSKVIIIDEDTINDSADVKKCFLVPDDFEFTPNLLFQYYKENNIEPNATVSYPCYPKTEKDLFFSAHVDYYGIENHAVFWSWLISKFNLQEVSFIQSPVTWYEVK